MSASRSTGMTGAKSCSHTCRPSAMSSPSRTSGTSLRANSAASMASMCVIARSAICSPATASITTAPLRHTAYDTPDAWRTTDWACGHGRPVAKAVMTPASASARSAEAVRSVSTPWRLISVPSTSNAASRGRPARGLAGALRGGVVMPCTVEGRCDTRHACFGPARSVEVGSRCGGSLQQPVGVASGLEDPGAGRH